MNDQQQNRLIGQVENSGIETIHLQFVDVPGTMKVVSIPAAKLGEHLDEGIWFDGSAIEGMARVAENDLYLHPDPSTFARLPWESRPAARVICDLRLPDGTPYPADPRNALRAVIAEAQDLGFEYRVASEVEFFIFANHGAETVVAGNLEPIDSSSYFDSGMSTGRAERVCRSAVQVLEGVGLDVTMTHHEVAPGQFEVDIAPVGALEAADAIITLKWALRALGLHEGLLVSFMPKPLEDTSGSGLHIQQFLSDCCSGADALYDPAGEYGLSEAGRQFIAGQLAHARGMCAVLAPVVNSYKRLMGGAEAPAHISWACTNQGALIRVPHVVPETRAMVELRAPDPSCNPYLAFAVMLKAGLDGIEGGTVLGAPAEHIVTACEPVSQGLMAGDPLPGMLGEALEELDWDPVVRAALGQPIFERFLAAKEQEWLAYRKHISLWELQHYLQGS